jgi:hypothetical protein
MKNPGASSWAWTSPSNQIGKYSITFDPYKPAYRLFSYAAGE